MLPTRSPSTACPLSRRLNPPPQSCVPQPRGQTTLTRRQRYGTLICDLERRRVLDLLPDREPSTVRAWLASHPDIAIIARDQANGFAGAAAAAAVDAVQVADRWHLMENASAAFLGAVRSVLGPSAGLSVPAPSTLTC
ncbi:transposase [Pseudoroseomonas wenyumeiae]